MEEEEEEQGSDQSGEDETLFTHCYACHEELPPRDKPAKKVRRRKCPTCLNLERKTRVRSDAGRYLFKKFYSAQRKKRTVPQTLLNTETIQRVFDRCGGKCVLTGVEDHTHLCIISTKNVAMNEDDLTLVSTSQAIKIAKLKSEQKEMLFNNKVLPL